MKLVDRFLQYVKFDTQSDELTNLTPSTPGQMVFAQELKKELEGMGLSDISLDENGYLMATLPSNTDKKVPTIGFIAHLDTAPDMSGHGVNPRVVKYEGGKVVLNDPNSEKRTYHTYDLSLILEEAKGDTPFKICSRAAS